MAKLRVAVIFGGKSNEHDISCISASHVIRSIPKERYDVVCVGITKKGHWLKYIGDIEDIATGAWEKHPDNVPCVLSPDPVDKGFLAMGEDGDVSHVKVDCVFPVLHGKNGEDGTIQGLLEMAQMPFVGCDLISSANCMDKELTHTVLDAHGIRTAPYVPINFFELSMLDEKCAVMEKNLRYPMYVKPANCGSSVGISKVTDLESLKNGIKMAFAHDKKVIVEQGIDGLECECAVMGNERPVVSAVGEISAANDFYDYDAKYNNSESQTFIPARIPDESSERIRATALNAYRAMGCCGLARVDFFLCKDGTVILNEINTMPGHTPISMFPQLFAYEGMTFERQEDKLIRLALERAGVDYE